MSFKAVSLFLICSIREGQDINRLLDIRGESQTFWPEAFSLIRNPIRIPSIVETFRSVAPTLFPIRILNLSS